MILLTGCTKSEQEPAVSEQENRAHVIAFSNMHAAPSRAMVDLSEYFDNFMVYGVKHITNTSGYTAEEVLVLPRYKVQTYLGGWGYEQIENQFLKFWDESSTDYLFSAVAPYPQKMDDIELLEDGEMTIKNIRGNTSSTPNWLVAQTQRDFTLSPLKDVDKLEPDNPLPPINTFYNSVSLRFHRFMAQVEFLAWSTRAVLLKEVRISLNNEKDMPVQGDYYVQDGTWDNMVNANEFVCNTVYPEGIPLSMFQETPTLLSSKVQIPQTWLEEGRKLDVSFIMTDGTKYEGTINLNEVTNKTNSWEANNIYRYIIKLDIDNGEEVQVILFAVDMDTWKWKEGNSVEETQTDW